MVLAYHVIFTAYGFWLPNDPRGSWSDFVRSWELFWFRPVTKTDERRSVAATPHDRARRLAAKSALRYPPVIFNGIQAKAIGEGFKHAAQTSGYTIMACSIMPEHVHMVIGRHQYYIEQVVGLLKGAATKALIAENLHPLKNARGVASPLNVLPSPWARKCWKVFLNNDSDIRRAVKYVNGNPTKSGLQPQHWKFITPV